MSYSRPLAHAAARYRRPDWAIIYTGPDAPAMPGEDELLDGFFTRAVSESPLPRAGRGHSLGRRTEPVHCWTWRVCAAMVLAYAGHGNYLGLQSCLTEDGAAGHDLRVDYEALFMQVAALGVTITLIGSAAAVPELWPP